MAAAHREGDHPVRCNPLKGDAERLMHEPQARQVVAVPDYHGTIVSQALRLAPRCHQAFLELLEIERAQRHPMGVTAQHVGQHQQAGHDLRLLLLHPRGRQEIAGEAGEQLNRIASLGHLEDYSSVRSFGICVQ